MKFLSSIAFGLLLAVPALCDAIPGTSAAPSLAIRGLTKASNKLCKCDIKAGKAACPKTDPKLKPPPKKKGGRSISARAPDYQGWYPSDLVDQTTTYVDMSDSQYVAGGRTAWTMGLSTCVGVVMFGGGSASATSGKILAHISPSGYQAQLTKFNTRVTAHPDVNRSPVIKLFIADKNSIDAQIRPAFDKMVADVVKHFQSFSGGVVEAMYNTASNSGRNGEMVVVANNRVYVNGDSSQCF
ncbi:hypothetical protein B0O99DRAFT_596078 [Bisporella sp. PMI_857]|nr:hypothetical protein B0O99DRAFT_596078 [Bisporella sp. PMI_857]